MWHRVFRLEDLPVGACRRVLVAGLAVALTRRQDGLFALEDRCPHDGGPLGDGTLEEGLVACPWHGWRFDPRTGVCLENENLKQACFATRVVEGHVEIAVSDRGERS